MRTQESEILSDYVSARESNSWLFSIGVPEVRVCVFHACGKCMCLSFAVWSFETCFFVTITDSSFESSPVQERIVAVHGLFWFAVSQGKIIFADQFRDTLIREVYMSSASVGANVLHVFIRFIQNYKTVLLCFVVVASRGDQK